jgi:hypothetical protein
MAAETIGEMQKRMDEASEKIGKAQAACEEKLTALKLKSNCMQSDGMPILPEKAMLIADTVIDFEGKKQISEFYTIYRTTMEWKATREMMLLQFEAKVKAAIEEGRAAGGSKGGGKGGEKKGGTKYLDSKAVGHMKDNKFGGKDGGVGWAVFLEDMMVIMGSVDPELESAAKEVTDLKSKDFEGEDGIKEYYDLHNEEMYTKYSGELYARLMEVTKDDAQKMVRNGGMKYKRRCGFRALRDLAERYNPKSYMKHLKMLLGVIKPAEAKSVKDVQAVVDEWEARLLRLEQEYGSEIAEDIKVAILISMVPEALQEKIFEIEKGMEKIKYGAARDVVITTALRKAEQRKPNDMDVGAVEKQQQEEEGAKWRRRLVEPVGRVGGARDEYRGSGIREGGSEHQMP